MPGFAEDSTEHKTARMIAKLDREHRAGQYTEEEYEDILRTIEEWADSQRAD